MAGAARTLGIGLRELTNRFGAESDDVTVSEAKISDGHLRARMAQKVAFRLAWRSFRWAATDLRRLRVTTVYGFAGAVDDVWWTLNRRYGARIAEMTQRSPSSEISRR